MIAEILSVGTELLLGDILNTNAQFLSRELAGLGINVYFQTVVGDNPSRYEAALEAAFSRAGLVIATGGLGPTDDDLTKEISAKHFNMPLIMDEAVLSGIENAFARMGAVMPENNKKQALIPEGAMVLENERGTAPGLIIEKDGKTLILLPGPPFEMERMFIKSVRPYLSGISGEMFLSKTLRLSGIGESAAAQKIKHILDAQTNPTIAPYAKQGEVTFRITAKAKDKAEAEKLIEPVSESIYNVLSDYIYGEGDTTLEGAVVGLLKEKGLKLAIAESCTGGLLSGRITNVPGASEVFLEGCVTYSNEAKTKRLGVEPEMLKVYGAVSGEVAEKMAKGIAATAGSDIGVGITGIAGPGGGSGEKPVGLVYIAIYYNKNVIVKKLSLNGDRERIRTRAVVNALDMIRRIKL